LVANNTRILAMAAMVVGLVLSFSGCGGPFVEVGPVSFTTEIGSGTLLEDIFTRKGGVPISHQEDFCDMPSEQALEEQFLQVGDVDISKFVRLSRLELVESTITATQGDFNFLSAMTVRFIPAPVNGAEQDPVVLGTASNANGLGTVVVLTPPAPVDFLDLIQQNDANPSSECPKLELEVTVRAIPTQDVSYTAEVSIDAYAEIGSF
jgi:hypothetical protein